MTDCRYRRGPLEAAPSAMGITALIGSLPQDSEPRLCDGLGL